MSLVTLRDSQHTRIGYYDNYGKFILHNPDGPAYIYVTKKLKTTMWYKFGKLHRIGQPAKITANDNFLIEEYYVEGKCINFSKHNKHGDGFYKGIFIN